MSETQRKEKRNTLYTFLVLQIMKLHYTCGFMLFTEDHMFCSEIVVRQMVKCSNQIEVVYFSCQKFGEVYVVEGSLTCSISQKN